MRKKIVFIVPSMRGGGAERVILNLINNLDNNKYDVSLILLQKQGPYLTFLPKSINIIDLNVKRVRYSLCKLIKTLNTIRPDVILSTLGHLNLGLLLIRKFIKGSPKIYVREANSPSKSMAKMSSLKRKSFYSLYKYLYPKADLIIAQCEEMKKDIYSTLGIEENKIKYIYNPINIKEIELKMEEFNPYEESKVNILAVGRCSYQKGFDVLINAMEIIVKKISNIHLTILGEGELKEELIKLVNGKNIEKHIDFVGFKENPYPYYYYSDLYVLSSRYEGFPNSLLEALACKTKVVSTDCKSGPKEIIGDNEYGFLVNEGDYISLADGILKALEEVNRTKDRALKYNIDTIINQYEELFSN